MPLHVDVVLTWDRALAWLLHNGAHAKPGPVLASISNMAQGQQGGASGIYGLVKI